jgi:hypothetical protein
LNEIKQVAKASSANAVDDKKDDKQNSAKKDLLGNLFSGGFGLGRHSSPATEKK